MERQFDQQLEKLKTKIIKMCSLVDEQIELVFKAIDEENIELANLIIERDKKVDKYDLKIDKICQKIIALNQPVAMDLRLIMSAITINTNLERIGDIAVNISKSFLKLQKKPEFINRISYYDMSKTVHQMLKDAIDSFIDNDPKIAQKVIQTDAIIDKMNDENHDLLLAIMKEDINNIDKAVYLLDINKQMERLGDHATNIAEDVYFIVEAQLIKHKYEKFMFNDDLEDDEE